MGDGSLFTFVVFSCILCTSTTVYRRPSFCDENNPTSTAHPYLWEVRWGGAVVSHLFGTVHVPWTRVRGGAALGRAAMRGAKRVYFELDLADPDTLARLAHCQMMPQGQNLSDAVPADLFNRLRRHLDFVRSQMTQWTGHNDDDALWRALAGDWEHKRPVWVMLLVNSLTEGEVRSRGVPVLDLWLSQEASRMRKHTAAVESVDEQCRPLNELDAQQVLFALNYTLSEAEWRDRHGDDHSRDDDALSRAYECGLLGADPLRPAWPPGADRKLRLHFRRGLLGARNRRMGARVVGLMREHPGERLFFAFGAGHFLGNDTVLDFVRAQGFDIRRVSFEDAHDDNEHKRNAFSVSIGEQQSAASRDADGIASTTPATVAEHHVLSPRPKTMPSFRYRSTPR